MQVFFLVHILADEDQLRLTVSPSGMPSRLDGFPVFPVVSITESLSFRDVAPPSTCPLYAQASSCLTEADRSTRTGGQPKQPLGADDSTRVLLIEVTIPALRVERTLGTEHERGYSIFFCFRRMFALQLLYPASGGCDAFKIEKRGSHNFTRVYLPKM